MSLFDRVVAASLPFVPKPIVGMVSRRYIAGETLADAVRAVKELNAEGAAATVDVLGEDTKERAQAERTVAEYRRVIEAIVENALQCNISIKLTALGLLIDESLCRDNVRAILAAARPHGMFVRIDMEDSSVTTRTLDVYRAVRKEYAAVGPVLQAYMRRSLADARSLLAEPPLNVRLCKGIYNEPAGVAFKDFEVVRRSYANLLGILLRAGACVGIATHDAPLLYEGLRLVDELRLAPEAYEFQMLLGVIPEMRRVLISEGHRLRVYVPFGQNWYGYSRRRLRENPKVAGFVLKNMFARR
ncbi:MAG: proline dehydrogenase family protein [Planctomycetes bacterium]|nr:proline dehydrogenase family protein [Planctomycetota bacterium]